MEHKLYIPPETLANMEEYESEEISVDELAALQLSLDGLTDSYSEEALETLISSFN